MINEKRLVSLLKSYYEAFQLRGKTYLTLQEEKKKIIGKALDSKILKMSSDETHVTNKICPKLSCGDSKMQKSGSKYICKSCGLSFDAKIWDEAAKAIQEYRKIRNETISELQKMYSELKKDAHIQDTLEKDLKDKYGKEKWWNQSLLNNWLFERID